MATKEKYIASLENMRVLTIALLSLVSLAVLGVVLWLSLRTGSDSVSVSKKQSVRSSGNSLPGRDDPELNYTDTRLPSGVRVEVPVSSHSPELATDDAGELAAEPAGETAAGPEDSLQDETDDSELQGDDPVEDSVDG